jgi:hypothetical protein
VAKAKGREAASDVDRLIEMGLNRYGAGDLDGAIFLWEEALAVDPDNQQATSYIDYVRLNFDVLSAEPSVEEPAETPYAIEEEPEYQIEITSGMAPVPAPAPTAIDPVDDGWFADEETHDAAAAPEPEGGALELEADAPAEPPGTSIEMEADEPPPPAINFDAGDTRKFHGEVQRESEPILPRPEDLGLDYGTAGPTTGFFRGDESTSYTSTTEEAPADDADADDNNDFGEEPSTAGFNPQGTPVGFANIQTGIRKRDLGFVQPTAGKDADEDIAIGSAPTQDKLAYEATQERGPFMGQASSDAGDQTSDDLLESLPVPRPRGMDPESGEIRLSSAMTLNFPEGTRAPARRDAEALSQAEVMLPHAPTRELTADELRVRGSNAMVGAPTREIGTRPDSRPLSNPDDDDAPTGQSDVRAIRAAHARNDGGTDAAIGEGTKHDIVLPFDPIAAASAQILDDVDGEAPSGESRDDQTRRRITRLLEKAGDWAEAGDLDKAVAAVDLALSEDADSALAQKLVTRNKETIMSLFQSYLGDLDRTPQLAKPLHELANAPISPRAAFLLSRIDGMLTIDELLDVSGMPRLEAYRYLCQLFLRGILR